MESSATPPHDAEQERHERWRDLGDRLFCAVLIVAVACAAALGLAWVMQMPSLR